MLRENFSRSVLRGAVFSLFILISVVAAKADVVTAGMLVAEGKRNHYIANQEEGILFAVYADGEWIRIVDGLGHICALAVCPDNSVYVVSRTQKRLFRVTSDGVLQMVRKFSSVPQAIYVDRDGQLHLVMRNGVVSSIE